MQGQIGGMDTRVASVNNHISQSKMKFRTRVDIAIRKQLGEYKDNQRIAGADIDVASPLSGVRED